MKSNNTCKTEQRGGGGGGGGGVDGWVFLLKINKLVNLDFKGGSDQQFFKTAALFHGVERRKEKKAKTTTK